MTKEHDPLSLSTKRLILQEYITNKSEVEFMKEVLLPLFEQMKFEVIYNHGPDELGKDFVLKKRDSFGQEEISCIVVKNGDISGSSKGSANLEEVRRQVDQSLTTTLDEFGLKGKLPHKVLVMTPGKISSQARRSLAQGRDVLSSTKVSFFWSEQLIPLVDIYYPIFFQVKLPITAKYLADLIGHIESITTIDTGFSSLISFANLKCFRDAKPYETGSRVSVVPDEVPREGMFSWLQGGTGSGKTYTVYKIAQRAITDLKSMSLRPKTAAQSHVQIPIYIKSSSLDFDISMFNLEEFLYLQMHKYSSASSLDDLKVWLKDFRVVIVVDEYEYKTPKAQLNKLANEVAGFPAACLLVCSRVLSESQLKFDRIPELWRMREMNLSNARKILYSSIPSENKKAISLYNEMLGNGVLERVPRTPLALNVLSQVFSGNVNSTPVNMFEFFDMFFELVLGRWEPKRDLESALDYNQIRGFLQEVAFDMISNSRLSTPVMLLIPIAERILLSTRNNVLKPLEFIELVAKYGEVAVVRDNEFSFTQRTFMEFLAGCEFEKYHWEKEFIITHITEVNWEDCLLFAAGSKKKDDGLLEMVDKIDEDSAAKIFFKTKNIAGLILALYRSDITKRLSALNEGVKSAVKLRDNESFEESIRQAFKDELGITPSLIALSIFSVFYGKIGLADILATSLINSVEDREKFYLLAAILETLDSNVDLARLMPHVPKEVNTKEGIAFGPFIQIESKQSENAEPIKSLLKEREIKKITDKAIQLLRDQRREKTKFIP